MSQREGYIVGIMLSHLVEELASKAVATIGRATCSELVLEEEDFGIECKGCVGCAR